MRIATLVVAGMAIAMNIVVMAQQHKPVARAPEPRETFPSRVQAALDQAELYWGRKADVRHVKFTFEDDSFFDKALGYHTNAEWIEETHTIQIDVQNWTDERLEAVITHEYGHALGIRHSQDPKNIMYFSAQESLEPWPHGLLAQAIDWSKVQGGSSGFDGTTITSGATGYGWISGGSTACFSYGNVQIGSPDSIVSINLPKQLPGTCDQNGWQKVLEAGATWTFRVDGTQITLTGAELAAAVKAAKDSR